jgi:hypothetical protein
MKTRKPNSLTGKISIAFLAIILTILSNSCSKSIPFLTSSVAPAARGDVKVTRDRNENYNIDIQLYNLSEVERLEGTPTTYIAWMETEQGNIINIGQLKSSSGLMSRTLKASLKTVSTAMPTRVFVTAEDNANAKYPGNIDIISTGTNRKY